MNLIEDFGYITIGTGFIKENERFIKKRNVHCWNDGESGFAEDMCSSGEDFSIKMVPDRTLIDGTVIKEMNCMHIETGKMFRRIQSPCIGSHLWTEDFGFPNEEMLNCL